jgi:localization factor PodJL
VRQRRRPHRDYYDDDEDSLSENLAAVTDRLDDLTRQLARVVNSNAARPEPEDRPPDRVAEAIAKLDRRLDHIIEQARADSIEKARSGAAEKERVPRRPSPSLAPESSGGPTSWVQEISARQRALNADAAPPAAAARREPGQDLSGLEHQLRQITTQISTLHRPYEDGVNALRGDLAEIGRALTEALPRRSVEALETQIRALAERVDRSRSAGVDTSNLQGLERGLAEVRDALRGLTPAENLVGVDEAVRALSRKIDQISASTHDPSSLQQIEQAITSLRGVVSNVASDGALAQLAAEVHALAGKFERTAANSSADALAKLDARIASLMESGRAIPPDLEALIRELSERLDRTQISQGGQLGSLEDRIVKLIQRLDASDARLGSLPVMERGITDILAAIKDLRAGSAAPRPAHPAGEALKGAFSSMPGAAQLQIAAPAAAHQAMPAEPKLMAPAPAAPARPNAAPAQRRPIQPHLPPDTPLEPGSGAPSVKPGTPAARIAASQAALGGAKPAASERSGLSAAVAAARSAAKSALAEVSQPKPKNPEPLDGGFAEEPVPLFRRIFKHAKTALVVASVIVIVLGMVQATIDYLTPTNASSATSAPAASPEPKSAPAVSAPSTRAVPSRSMPTPDLLPLPEPEPNVGPTGQIGPRQLFDSNSLARNLSAGDVTHSVTHSVPPRATLAPSANPASSNPAPTTSLPSSFGPLLRAGAASNDPAAEYEIALRYAEGRGVRQSFEETARWLERAANSGFAPAQFRLASLNEKGEGLKKDLQAARRLYISAANKGHAKAMHNLGVLYAEGIDGKPDYKSALQWFRKAADYGIPDSQYNLAILYTRGIGVEQNLGEAYKWFALAANKGDGDASRKRDEVGTRLEKSSLMAAKLAAQTFTPEREPDEATNLRVPPGGWERPNVMAQPAKPKLQPPMPLR